MAPNAEPAFFVYILYCPVTRLNYVGQTSHLLLRYYEHRDGKSRWTRRMKQPLIVHWEPAATRTDAMARESYLKQGAGFRFRQEIVRRAARETCGSGG